MKQGETRIKQNKESDLVYNNEFNLYKDHNINEFKTISTEAKNHRLLSLTKLNEFNSVKPQKTRAKDKNNRIKIML